MNTILANGAQLNSSLRKAVRGLADNMPIILLLLTLILFVSKSLYNIPMAIMAVFGAWQSLKNPSILLTNTLIRSFIIVFMCVWLPMLIALIDAVAPAYSTLTVFPYLRYLFAGIYIINSSPPQKLIRVIIAAIFAIVSFWSLDASVQYLFGRNLLGYPYETGHITGMFYPRNTIAHLLAALSPIYFESLRKHGKSHKWLWLLLLPLVAVILLSGRRASWIMLILSTSGYMFYLYKLGEINLKAKKRLLLIGLTITIVSILVVASSKPLQKRLAITSGVFSLDYETIDRATAARLPIWETSLAVFQDNWLNGIGPRGFRHVYTEYSREDDIWHLTGTTNPHQLVLEILAETGVIGFAGLVCFVFMLYRLYRNLPDPWPVYPFALSVFVVLFPINTSMAFYGSYWSSVIWWLVILAYVSINGTPLLREHENNKT